MRELVIHPHCGQVRPTQAPSSNWGSEKADTALVRMSRT